MQRSLMSKLQAWKESEGRKPLLLTGVRNVGKTWILKEFGQLHYSSVAYFNIEQDSKYHKYFAAFCEDKDAQALFKGLSSASKQRITPESLIIFDEIYADPAAIDSLKYLADAAPECHVVSAASWFVMPEENVAESPAEGAEGTEEATQADGTETAEVAEQAEPPAETSESTETVESTEEAASPEAEEKAEVAEAAEPQEPPVSFKDNVQCMQLFPLSFGEFLLANGRTKLAQYLEDINTLELLPEPFLNQLYEQLKMYMITGGMPEPLNLAIQEKNISGLQPALNNVAQNFIAECTNSADSMCGKKALRIWVSLPLQLDNANKKFSYQQVVDGGSARDYDDGLKWLEATRAVYHVKRCSDIGYPLSDYDEKSSFKMYGADVGILRTLARIPMTMFQEGMSLFAEKHGALSENFVMQSLAQVCKVPPRYWSRPNPFIVADFLWQRGEEVIPVLVRMPKHKGRSKSLVQEPNLTADKALLKINELYPNQIKLAVIFSLGNLQLDGNVLHVPLFMAEYIDKLVEIALEKLQA